MIDFSQLVCRIQFNDYRTFYSRYPQIVQTVSALLPVWAKVEIERFITKSLREFGGER